MSDDTFTANVNEVSSSSPHPCTTSSPRRKCWSAWRNVCRNRWPGPPCRRTPSRPSSVPSPAVWLMSDQSFPRRLRRQSREGGAAHRHRGRQQPAGVPDRDAKEALAVRRRPFRAGQQDPSGTSTRSATSLYVILSHDLISVLTNGPKPAAVLDNLLNVVGVDPFCGSGALLHARSRDGCGGVARHADPRHRAADRASRRVTVQLKLGDTQLSAKEPRLPLTVPQRQDIIAAITDGSSSPDIAGPRFGVTLGQVAAIRAHIWLWGPTVASAAQLTQRQRLRMSSMQHWGLRMLLMEQHSGWSATYKWH